MEFFKNIFKSVTKKQEGYVEEWIDEDYNNLDLPEEVKMRKLEIEADLNYYNIRLREAEMDGAVDLISFYKREIRKL